MEELKNSGASLKGGGRADEAEIIDVADLLEESEPSISGETLDLVGPDPADIAAVDLDAQEGEDPIDLNEIFSELDETDSFDDEEEIIELVDMVDDGEEKGGPPLALAHKVDEKRTDVVDDFTLEDFDLELPPSPGQADELDEDELDLDEDFISAFELEEILSDTPKSQDGIGLSEDAPPEPETGGIDLIDSFDLDLSEFQDDMLEEKEEVASSPDRREEDAGILTAAAGGRQPLAPAAMSPLDIRVSEEQIDAAVERVIRKMLGDKIDAILVEAIEKAVLQEIGRLKNMINLESLEK